MLGWHRELKSFICCMGKRLEYNWNAVAVYHSMDSLISGDLFHLQGLQKLPSSNSPIPLYHYLPNLGLFTSLRWWIGDAYESAAVSSPHELVLPSNGKKVDAHIKDFLVNQRFARRTFCSLSVTSKCWNCGSVSDDAIMPFLICKSCRSIQPVNRLDNYFQIFRLERKYEIEEGNLDGTYKDWQKKLHPDLVYSKSKRERQYAAEQSARVIDAYRTLTNPLSRAVYIMRLEGVEVDEEERILDPELLDEVMEIREAVDEARGADTLNQLRAQIEDKFKHWCKSFSKAFVRKDYDEALVSIRRMTYYKRAIEEIVKKL